MAVQAHEVRGPALGARGILRLNALASVTAGVALLLGAEPIARAFGAGTPAPVAIAGAALVVYGLDAFGFAVRRSLRRVHVVPFAVVDLAVLVGGVTLVVAGPVWLTTIARVAVLGGAIVSGWFALAQLRAARSL